MYILIPKPTKETLEKNGGEYAPHAALYHKKINKCSVCIRDPDDTLPFECWIPNMEDHTPDDLIAIGEELKKLEEN